MTCIESMRYHLNAQCEKKRTDMHTSQLYKDVVIVKGNNKI